MFNLRRILSVLFVLFTITSMVSLLYYTSSSTAALQGAFKYVSDITDITQNAEEEVHPVQELEHEPAESFIQPDPHFLATVGYPEHLNLRPQLLNHDFTKPPSA